MDLDYTLEFQKKVKALLDRELREQELLVAKFIVDNPDADMTRVRLVYYWSYDESHAPKRVTRVDYE